MKGNHPISEVSRIAGIPKDLLRMWERRYGYPKPVRDHHGDRVYSDEELDKLVAIRQLLEQGRRPGKLMALDLPQLRSLMQSTEVELDTGHLVALLEADDTVALRSWFQQHLATLGLRAFIHKVVAPATHVLGEAWARGELEIYQEHLYTELMKSLVRHALVEHYQDHGEPRVMLTTMQGEPHSLGLLMVEALLRIGRAEVISFGTEMPIRDITRASVRHKVDVIGLSFSCNYRSDEANVILSGLRQRIDPKIQIWVGGGAFSDASNIPEGIELIGGLQEVERALAEWKRSDTGA